MVLISLDRHYLVNTYALDTCSVHKSVLTQSHQYSTLLGCAPDVAAVLSSVGGCCDPVSCASTAFPVLYPAATAAAAANAAAYSAADGASDGGKDWFDPVFRPVNVVPFLLLLLQLVQRELEPR